MGEELQVFRLGRAARIIRVLLIAVGGVAISSLLWLPKTAAGIVSGLGIVLVLRSFVDMIHPIFVLTPEGLLLKGAGFKGTDKLIRWTSVRDLTRDGAVMQVRLPNRTWMIVRLGRLSPNDRDRLVAEVQRRGVMPNKRIDLTRVPLG